MVISSIIYGCLDCKKTWVWKKNMLKNLPASRAHSHRALRAQLASLASLSAPRARDSIVALRAPFLLDLALRARSCALHIHSSLFIII